METIADKVTGHSTTSANGGFPFTRKSKPKKATPPMPQMEAFSGLQSTFCLTKLEWAKIANTLSKNKAELKRQVDVL